MCLHKHLVHQEIQVAESLWCESGSRFPSIRAWEAPQFAPIVSLLYTYCLALSPNGDCDAYISICMHRMWPWIWGDSILLRWLPDRVPAMQGWDPQGLYRGRSCIQGVRILQNRFGKKIDCRWPTKSCASTECWLVLVMWWFVWLNFCFTSSLLDSGFRIDLVWSHIRKEVAHGIDSTSLKEWEKHVWETRPLLS